VVQCDYSLHRINGARTVKKVHNGTNRISHDVILYQRMTYFRTKMICYIATNLHDWALGLGWSI